VEFTEATIWVCRDKTRPWEAVRIYYLLLSRATYFDVEALRRNLVVFDEKTGVEFASNI
jgi:uncharacterized membrane protein